MACDCHDPKTITKNRNAIRRQSDGSIKITINGVSYKVPEFGDTGDSFDFCEAASGSISCLISSDSNNIISMGPDGLLYAEDNSGPPVNLCDSATELADCIISSDADNTLVQGTDGLLYVSETPFEFPVGTEGQIITYDDAGVPVVVSLEEYNQDIIQTVVGEDGWSTNPDMMLIVLDSQTGNLAAAKTSPFWTNIPEQYGSIVTRSDDQSGTPGRIAGADPTDDFDMVNLRSLRASLPNFHATEVGAGVFLTDLSVVGTTTGATASTTVDNTDGSEPMVGIARFTSFSSQLRRVGNGAISILEQLSYDGGDTWIDLTPNNYDRSGAPAGFTTSEVCQLTRASAFEIPAGETLDIASRIIVEVETPYEAGAVNLGHELEVIAGTKRP